MQHGKTAASRLLSIMIAIIFLMMSLIVCIDSVSAASKPEISPTSKTITVGKTVKITSNVNVKWSIPKGSTTVKLTSVKKKSVVVKGLKSGTIYITAAAGNQKTKSKIHVKANSSNKIKLMPSKTTIGIGDDAIIVASSSLDGKIVFSSNNSKIAKVTEKGLVTGVSPGKATITAKLKNNSKIKAKVTIKVVNTRAGVVTMHVDMTDKSKYPAGKVAKVWIPIPKSDDSQTITSVDYDAARADRVEITTDSSGGKSLYVEWGSSVAPAERIATLSYHVRRNAVERDDKLASKEKGTVDAEAYSKYLHETIMSGSFAKGSIVRDTADKIVADAKAKTVYDKAYAIYTWVVENLYRDKNVPDRVRADVETILKFEKKPGSCVDVNSVFVALCNAEGIPARDLFGTRLSDDMPGPNCRAQFYLPGYGWVDVDPAMTLREIWYEEDQYRGENAPQAAKWELYKDKYWGNAEENWICLSDGRDITLSPSQTKEIAKYKDLTNVDGTLNFYMFPYCEFDGQYLSGQDFKTLKYYGSFEEEDPADCGC